MITNTTYQLSSSLGGRYPIDPNGLTIGRSRTNTIAINDPRVSRFHARLLFAGGRYWIRDEKSQAGILVNGCPVAGQQEFKPGDILQIGSVTFWLTSAAQAASQPHSPIARTKRTNLVYVGITGVLLIILMIAIGTGGGGGMSNGNIQRQTLPTEISMLEPTSTITPSLASAETLTATNEPPHEIYAGFTENKAMPFIMIHQSGESLVVTQDNNSSKITGVVWTSADGQSIVIYADSDGYPKSAVGHYCIRGHPGFPGGCCGAACPPCPCHEWTRARDS